MSSFVNVEVQHKANIYHDGRVTSRTVIMSDHTRKTLGFMLAGTYEFNTAAAEVVDVTQGSCKVRLDGETEWKEYKEGESFSVPANSRFDIEVPEMLDYVCHFDD